MTTQQQAIHASQEQLDQRREALRVAGILSTASEEALAVGQGIAHDPLKMLRRIVLGAIDAIGLFSLADRHVEVNHLNPRIHG